MTERTRRGNPDVAAGPVSLATTRKVAKDRRATEGGVGGAEGAAVVM